MKFLLIITSLILASGCATNVKYTPPTPQKDLPISVEVDQPRNVVWDNVIENLSGSIWSIDTISSGSNFIGFPINGNSQYIDCGFKTIKDRSFPLNSFSEYKLSVGLSLLRVRMYPTISGKVNVIVRESKDKKSTRIKYNILYSVKFKRVIHELRGILQIPYFLSDDVDTITFTSNTIGHSNIFNIYCMATGELENIFENLLVKEN
jgi:hypothetical protein